MSRKEDVEALITNQVREDRGLDYKQERPAPAQANLDKKSDFLVDVSAFANGAGGVLLYGIVEQRDEGKPTGLPDRAEGLAGFILDAEENRLRQYLDAGIDPKLPPGALEFAAIDGFTAGPVLAVRVRRSWIGPHMVRAEGRHRYSHHIRDGNMNRLLDARALRDAILVSEGVSRRLHHYRDDRVAAVAAGETPAVIDAGAKLVLHVVPFSALEERTTVDPREVDARLAKHNAFPLYTKPDATHRRYNADGLVVEGNRSADRSATTYLQIFRSGIIEAVDTGMLNSSFAGEEMTVPTLRLELELLEMVPRYIALLADLGQAAPFAIFLSLLGVRGFYHVEAKTDLARAKDSVPTFDRDTVRLPEIVIDLDDLSKPITKTLEPLIQMLWQAGGCPACPRYEDGKYDKNKKVSRW